MDMDKLKKEKEKLERSIREGQKYFLDPTNRKMISRSWGYEDVICNLGKEVFIKKGKKTSWHSFVKKDSVVFVISGRLHISYTEENDLENFCEILLSEGDAFKIPPEIKRQYKALSDCRFIEFSSIEEEEIIS